MRRPSPDSPPARHPWRRALWWWALATTLALPAIILTVLRIQVWDVGTPWVQLLSGYPLTLPLTVLALVAALLGARSVRRRLGRPVAAVAVPLVVLAVMLTQAAMIAPRVIPGLGSPAAASAAAGTPASQRTLTVMALNIGSKGWDAPAILAAAEENQVDLLALPELGPLSLEALDAAGIDTAFPHKVTDVNWEDIGSGMFSRLPLVSGGKVPGSEFNQSTGTLDPGSSSGAPVKVTAVHIDSPRPGHIPRWRTELAYFSQPSSATILLGDFNATVDHPEFRSILSAGFTDAAMATGGGLQPTWPVNSSFPAYTTLDHILVSPDITVQSYRTVQLPGTDHAAVVAVLQLPG